MPLPSEQMCVTIKYNNNSTKIRHTFLSTNSSDHCVYEKNKFISQHNHSTIIIEVVRLE